MALSDPLADMMTRIRNGQMAQLETIESPTSKLRNAVLEVLKKQGFIEDFDVINNPKSQDTAKITLRYTQEGTPAIREMKRVSKPSCRVYSGLKDLQQVYNGLGVAILSTTKGVMTDHDARQSHVGGEILAEVF